jgi:hypothetical protein
MCVHWFVELPGVGSGWGSTCRVQNRPFLAPVAGVPFAHNDLAVAAAK